MNNFTLGLDLGTSSIGWAILEQDGDGQPKNIASNGVRIFQEVTDAKTKTPKNQTRRNARSSRRLISRRKMRRNSLLNLLVRNKLLPEDVVEREKLFSDNKQFDPYQLRKKALDNKLAPHEFGRVLYHLNQRRGFQSNRKTKSKDEGEVKTGILSLRHEIETSGCRTLGEYLAGQSKKRERYTDRAMYQEEFKKIWQEQQKYYPEISPAFMVTVHNTIFFQRPLKLQKNLVGKCTFEPSRKRAARALLEAQRFRILQDLNNLTVKNPITRDFHQLTKEERTKLFTILEKQKTLSWDKARKVLKIHDGEIFNLEEGKKKELIGNRTTFALRKILGKKWDEMPQDKQNALITDMLTIDNTQGFLNRMTSHWGFDNDIAEKLAETELEPGYMRLSRKAMCMILPYLEQGMIYDKACNTAGYDHSNPDSKIVTDKLTEPPYLRNPVVQKALYETRKLINAINREYGKPETIRIEMARDMKLTKKQKENLQKEQNTRKKENERTKERLQKEFGIQHPTREDIQKYNLWQECKEICPYTGKPIAREMLFSPDVEIEHILPYSRSLDDSYMNKTLCIADENRNIKHNKTPYEAYGANQEKYLEILQRVKTLPYPKRRRFEQKEIDTEQCITRQLNDTRYICTEVKQYLRQLGANVEISKGEATAALRYRWGLNRILSSGDLMQKNREDHRHHAIDAVVIALTSRYLFQQLSRLSASSGVSLSERRFHLDTPWQNFYEDVKAKVESIVVSHAPSRKISGALHEDTAYGYDEHNGCYVYRVPLSKITEKMIKNIRDKKVKELVMQRLEKCGGDLKKAFGNDADLLLHADGKTPIKSVRISKKASNVYPVKLDGRVYKFFELGSNHHVEIVENIKTGKREGRFVTTMEAARRARIDKTSIVHRNHSEDWRFIMSLAINDMVEIEEDGIKRYYRVQKMSDPTITMRLHSVTTTSNDTGVLRKSPNTLCCRKVSVDSLGNIVSCND